MTTDSEEKEVVGGWKMIRGERRFIPLKTKNVAHCKSCLFYRKSAGGYCELDPNLIVTPESVACEGYVNRTWKK